MTPPSPDAPVRSGTRDVLLLALAQAFGGANSAALFATGAIVGHTLAPSEVLATLPISIFVVGMAACTLPAGILARRYGRQAAFLAGTGAGMVSGLLAAWVVFTGSFWLFCAAMFLGGAYAAVILSFRFAAADCVPPHRQPRALSAVMAGGVFSGVLGPQLVTVTMDLWQPHLFAVTFLAQAALAAVCAFVLLGVRMPMPSAAERRGGRPLGVIVRQSRFITAVVCGVVSYMLMNFVMTAAPLAMRLCGLSQESSNLGLQWHIIAMYAPSFFTGRLIERFGVTRIIACGLVLTAAAVVVGLLGIEVVHFWLTLALLGVGWNFAFVGASAMVLEAHRPDEKTRVQSLNDFIVFGTMAVGSFLSGGLLTAYGWNTVLWVSFFPLALAVAALVAAGASRGAHHRA